MLVVVLVSVRLNRSEEIRYYKDTRFSPHKMAALDTIFLHSKVTSKESRKHFNEDEEVNEKLC